MDTSVLVDDQRKVAGANLLRSLDTMKFPTSAAFWYRRQDTDDWTLIIASSLVRTEGPDFVYQQIQKALGELQEPGIALMDICVVKDSEPLVQAIGSDARTSPTASAGVGLYHTAVGGVYIDGVYIYRAPSN